MFCEVLRIAVTYYFLCILGDDMIRSRLEHIATEEKVKFEDGVLKTLVKTSDGDLRRAITSLQSCVRLKGIDKVLTVDDVREVSGVWTLINSSSVSLFVFNKHITHC